MPAKDRESRIVDQLGYSQRRALVDDFFFRVVPAWQPNSLVLDLGGHKINKRGRFDISAYPLDTTYANLTTAKRPDIQADAAAPPFPNAQFDYVICAELLEHVPDPRPVLTAAYRVLKPGGSLAITVPFLIGIHGDPDDYGRYTPSFWQTTLQAIGFNSIHIEKQGLYWSVLAEMIRAWAYERAKGRRPRPVWLRGGMAWGVNWLQRQALRREARPGYAEDRFYGSYTTGFGILCNKPNT